MSEHLLCNTDGKSESPVSFMYFWPSSFKLKTIVSVWVIYLVNFIHFMFSLGFLLRCSCVSLPPLTGESQQGVEYYPCLYVVSCRVLKCLSWHSRLENAGAAWKHLVLQSCPLLLSETHPSLVFISGQNHHGEIMSLCLKRKEAAERGGGEETQSLWLSWQ